MGQIFIANIDNEDMLADRSVLTYEFRCHSAVAASKHAWFAEVGDIVVLPEPLSNEMHEYMAKVKEIPPDSVSFIVPSRTPVDVCPLGANVLDDDLLDRLKQATNGNGHWELRPYHHDGSSARLAKKLGFANGNSKSAFFEESGAELFNNKKIFRGLAAGRGVQVARGGVVFSQSQLMTAVDELIDATGAVIVKQNCHSGALGNIIVAVTQDVSGQGASEVLFVNDRFPLSKAARFLWESLAVDGAGTLVVEVYYPVSTDCYAEFFISDRGDVPRLLNLGEQRMEPLFAGFEIPGRIPAYQLAQFISGATELVRLAQDLGFTGLIDVDGIITCDGQIIFCEVNGRYGGASHIHYLAEKLLGAGYGNTHTLLTKNGVAAPLFGDLVRIIEDQALNLTAQRCEGILITAEDTARTGTLDYVVAADDRARAYDIERWFIAVLEGAHDEHQPQLRVSAGYH